MLIGGRVVHQVPGRLRAKLPGIDAATAASVERAVAGVRGVANVRLTPLTESLVVHFDPAELDAERLLRLLRSKRVLDLQPLDPDHYARISKPPSEVAFGVKRLFHEVDVRLADLTDGKWDLRSVVPFVFGALALRALIANPSALGAAPWYALAWYAFDSFWKLNDQKASSPPPATKSDTERDT